MTFSKEIEEKIDSYKDELLYHLTHLVEIPSVSSSKKEGMPFGVDSFRALSYVLKLAEDMGFDTYNCDGYAGHAEYGSGDEYVGVAVHVDVVPASEGWDSKPFTLTKKDGKIYGRGVSDDKGPAICALYAMKALRELGLTGDRRLRLIIGSGEETGMTDLSYYFKKEPYPTLGFSPDGDYPMANSESGILNILGKFKGYDSVVKKFYGGLVYNAVPSYAFCIIDDRNVDIDSLNEKAKTYQNGECQIIAEMVRGELKLSSTGRASHASVAEYGFNAVLNLMLFVADTYGERAGKAFLEIADRFKTETDGKSLGIAMCDSISKPLTLNIGKVIFEGGKGEACIDIRYPVTADGEAIVAQLKDALKQLTLTVEENLNPLYVEEDSELISKLRAVYEESTGKDGKPVSMAGGTYARVMGPCAVAFGASFGDGSEGNIHMPNEFITEESLIKNAKICAKAMIALMQK